MAKTMMKSIKKKNSKKPLGRTDKVEVAGSQGLIKRGNNIQVVYGPQVSVIKNEIEEMLGDE